MGLSFPLNRAFAPEQSELQWCTDFLVCAACQALAVLAMRGVVASAVTTRLSLSLQTRGRLGDGTATVSKNTRRLLLNWAVPLALTAVLFCAGGCVQIVQAFTQVGQTSAISGRKIEPLYAYTTMVLSGLVFAIYVPLRTPLGSTLA